MRKYSNNRILHVAAIALMGASPLLYSCSDDDEATKWVDLRYRVEDSYELPASNPDDISFVVKSTSDWEVFGANGGWYTISPSSGGPGESYTVTIKSDDNTGLDDRTDTIYIKSDYWTGKQFTIMQHGTAFLETAEPEAIPQEGGTSKFAVTSNQKWSVKVTSGTEWLSVSGATDGEGDGEVTVSAAANAGEQRSGIVTVYDRHGKVAREVECMQNGVVIEPDAPDNGLWLTTTADEHTFTIHVESNADWTVAKQDEETEDWYDIRSTEFSGSGDIMLDIQANPAQSVRNGYLILSTKPVPGSEPVTKVVRFKQAYTPAPEPHVMNKEIGTSNYWGPSGLQAGYYSFYFSPLGSTNLRFFLTWEDGVTTFECRYHIIDGKPDISTTPWQSFRQPDITVDTSQEVCLSFYVYEVVDDKGSWIGTDWIYDGEVIASSVSNAPDGTSWKCPFAEIVNRGMTFITRVDSGSATLTKYEYTGPINWGD